MSGDCKGLKADVERCRAHVEGSTAAATALVPALGYEGACRVAKAASGTGRTVRQVVLDEKLMTAAEFDALVSPEAVCRLGMPDRRP
jgi:aspartate ammonia-lyase